MFIPLRLILTFTVLKPFLAVLPGVVNRYRKSFVMISIDINLYHPPIDIGFYRIDR